MFERESLFNRITDGLGQKEFKLAFRIFVALIAVTVLAVVIVNVYSACRAKSLVAEAKLEKTFNQYHELYETVDMTYAQDNAEIVNYVEATINATESNIPATESNIPATESNIPATK